jgi:transcriptional regulator with XRE-family HTH domain
VNQEKFFKALGTKVRGLRRKRGYSQEDMIYFGFSARHWQQIEAGRPITMTTLLRICEVFGVPMANVVRGLDAGIYEKPTMQPPFRKKR